MGSSEVEGEKTWRCFHCDTLFLNPKHAAEHFGVDEMETPACRLRSSEGHLVTYVRRLEAELAEYRDDRHPVILAQLSQESEHRIALQREEEVGYARGLRDARAQGWASPADVEVIREQITASVIHFITGRVDSQKRHLARSLEVIERIQGKRAPAAREVSGDGE